jgi:ATP:ADP antiporter, AAA family
MSETQEKTSFLGKVRTSLWPINGIENKKFLPMAFMMGLILFNYTILRGTKDTLMISGDLSSSGVFSYLKLFGVLPAAILFFIVYTKLSNILSRPMVFYSVVLFFLLFFGCFSTLIYPNQAMLHMSDDTIRSLQTDWPSIKWMIPMIGYWTNSLFYIMSELWGSVVLSLLFWQFANLNTKVTEAKRYYAHFGLVGNFFVLGAGLLLNTFSSMRDTVSTGVDPWGYSLHWIMASVVISGILVMALFFTLNNNILKDKRFAVAEGQAPKKKKKPKLSLGESFKAIFTSKYLGFIVLLVLMYGITINLIEIVWKQELKLAFPTDNEYGAAMGSVLQYTGLVTIIIMLIGSNILRMFSWLSAALITPAIILITGGGFFTLIIFSDQLSPMITGVIGTTALMLAVWFGAIQNVLSKAVKYSLFDPTKEMSYIPLDDEMKVKGKAAVDVVGGRLGKSGGALINILLFTIITGTPLELAPYLGVITMIGMAIWFFAVFKLNGEFLRLTKKPTGEGPKDKAANVEDKDKTEAA